MKLRIKGNSLRLRVSRSELARLVGGSRIEETIQFTPACESRFTYALDSALQGSPIRVNYGPQKITVVLAHEKVLTWSSESEIGVYGTVDIGSSGQLEIIVEKDFACLDRSDEENQDTFANPHAGATC